MRRHLNATGRARLMCAAALLGLTSIAAPTKAAQPVIATPAGTPLLPHILYAIPYATYSPNVVGAVTTDTETIVTVDGTSPTAGTVCRFQVEWLDWNAVSAGVSGPAAPPVGGSFEFVTLPAPGPAFFPYTLNVFSDLKAPFEGFANVRSDCAASTKTGIDAEFGLLNGPNAIMPVYKTILVIKPTGNVGD